MDSFDLSLAVLYVYNSSQLNSLKVMNGTLMHVVFFVSMVPPPPPPPVKVAAFLALRHGHFMNRTATTAPTRHFLGKTQATSAAELRMQNFSTSNQPRKTRLW